MPISKATIDHEKLAQEICKELDEMNNTGFGSSVEWAIGEYLGMQVRIKITRDDDDLMDDMEPENELIRFENISNSIHVHG